MSAANDQRITPISDNNIRCAVCREREGKVMEKIYRRIHAWAERKIRACQTHDRKCEHCLQWYSIVGWGNSCTTDNPVVDEVTCGGCGKVTEWFMGSMLPLWLSEIKVKFTSTEKEQTNG